MNSLEKAGHNHWELSGNYYSESGNALDFKFKGREIQRSVAIEDARIGEIH